MPDILAKAKKTEIPRARTTARVTVECPHCAAIIAEPCTDTIAWDYIKYFEICDKKGVYECEHCKKIFCLERP